MSISQSSMLCVDDENMLNGHSQVTVLDPQLNEKLRYR